MAEDHNRWIRLIKQLRQEHGVGLFEAERIALSHPEWRRWVERQVNVDAACRKAALSHLRHHGPNSLVLQEGQTLRVR
jgi:hypothetical protein